MTRTFLHPTSAVLLAVGFLLIRGVAPGSEGPIEIAAGEEAEAPSPHSRMLLSGRAHRSEHRVSVAGTGPSLDLRFGGPLRVGWSGSLAIRVTGVPGDTARLLVGSRTGEMDSLAVVIGAGGTGEGGLRVMPALSEWVRWEALRPSTGEVAAAATWVREEEAPRVRILAGPPTWESRFLLQALEEAGARVELRQELGRGFRVASPAGEGPVGSGDAPHVTILLPGAELSSGERDALLERLRSGMGLVLVGVPRDDPTRDVAAALELETFAGVVEREAAQLEWNLPPEILPLPPVELVLPVAAPDPARPDSPLQLAQRGMGRVAVLGTTESWRWRMEAGAAGAHRDFWRSLVDWVGANASPEGWVGAPAEAPADGSPLALHRRSGDDGRPSGTLERRLPAAPDSVRVLAGDVTVFSAPVAVDGEADGFGWARLALAVGRAPRGTVSGPWTVADPPSRWSLPGAPPPWVLLILLAGAALVGWLHDRLRGRP